VVFNKCEMTGKLKEIYCENGLVTIKIYWDKNNTIFNAVKYKNENVILNIKEVKMSREKISIKSLLCEDEGKMVLTKIGLDRLEKNVSGI